MRDGGATFTGFFCTGCGAGAGDAAVVAALVAEAEPDEFEAVTVARSVLPTSAEPTAYWAAVAPAIDAQLAPAVSQRFHW